MNITKPHRDTTKSHRNGTKLHEEISNSRSDTTKYIGIRQNDLGRKTIPLFQKGNKTVKKQTESFFANNLKA